MKHHRRNESEKHHESLEEEATHILEEARMVVPGIQALFGFQLVVVFQAGFEKLEPWGQRLHLVAMGMVAVALALIMTPAAYHRQAEPDFISGYFSRVSSRLLSAAMFFLLFGINADFYLILKLVLKDGRLSLAGAAVLTGVYLFFWTFFPWTKKHRRWP
jgi:hypothetical protein